MNKAIVVLENMTSNEREKIVTELGEISDNADLGRQAQYLYFLREAERAKIGICRFANFE